MSTIKVNTDAVLNAANSINSYNNSIDEAFNNVVSSIISLVQNWDGAASENAIQSFRDIEKHRENRYATMNNYVVFLRKHVGEGYEYTESTNNSLANSFK